MSLTKLRSKLIRKNRQLKRLAKAKPPIRCLIIEWKDGLLISASKKREGYKNVPTEEHAKGIISRLEKNNILAATYFDEKRNEIKLIEPPKKVPNKDSL